MTIISDNEATDALADLVGRHEVTRLMASLGFPGTMVRFSDLEWDRLSALEPAYATATGDKTVAFPFEKHSDKQVREVAQAWGVAELLRCWLLTGAGAGDDERAAAGASLTAPDRPT